MEVTTLKIDVDWRPPRDDWVLEWINLRRKMIGNLGYEVLDVSLAYSDKGFHVFFYIKGKLEPEEILKLQFILGDDPVRCKINYMRLLRGTFPRLNIIFDHVTYRRPPDEKCLTCKVWRAFKELVEGEKPPMFAVEFTVPSAEEVRLRKICYEISLKDQSFYYRIEPVNDKTFKLTIYAPDKNTAYKRGVWFKAKVFSGKYRFKLKTLAQPR